MFIINHRKIFYVISAFLIAGSIFSISFWGLKPGIDFAGGSLIDVSFESASPTGEEISSALTPLGLGDSLVRKSDNGYLIQTKEISMEQKDEIISKLSFDGKFVPKEKTFSSVGPVLGNEAVKKSWISIALVLLAIVLFIAFAFRKVSRPISSWVYGWITIFALLHDVLVPTGAFAILGYLYGFEVDTLFVTALLVILGFSVHDTIVVFDRVRENLHKNIEYKEGKDFETIVGESISQTLVRSLNTSLTTLLAILVLYMFGPESVRHFSLVLLIGITIGTYSSIFIGSPLLVTINNWRNKGK
jgi:preprotein translocase subunit SecF